jgi:putative ABC transport system permease protein
VADLRGRRRAGLWHCGVPRSSVGGCDGHVDLRRPCRDRPTSISAVATTAQGGTKVTTLGETQALISSSLTAVDLRGLTALELAFSVMMIAGVTGLVLALGLAERRRSFTILSALGATPKQLGAFLWAEGLFIVLGGAIMGMVVGFGVAYALVALLSGVFDPPPETLSVPWLYVTVALVTALACGSIAIAGTLALSKKPDLEALRGG